MARENTVILYGWVACPPRMRTLDEYSGEEGCAVDVLTLRRSAMDDDGKPAGNERLDVIPVITKNRTITERTEKQLTVPDNADPGSPGYLGYIVMVKGTLCTEPVMSETECPHCGGMTLFPHTASYVDPLIIEKMHYGKPETREGAMPVLRAHLPIGNLSLMYGTLWADPSYYEGGHTELRFSLRSVRKRHIYEDPDDRRCDYPWIRSFGRHNGEYAKIVKYHAGMYVSGAVQARKFEGRQAVCDSCGELFGTPGETCEIVPYRIRYQGMHLSDEDEAQIEDLDGFIDADEEAAKQGFCENTAMLYGWICDVPQIVYDGDDACAAVLKIMTFRKAYETDDPVHRGDMTQTMIRLRTEDPEIISYISDFLCPPQEKGKPHRGCLVLAKGILSGHMRKVRKTCPECGAEYVRSWQSTEFKPTSVWRESAPMAAPEAAFVLHGAVELCNMAWCCGTVSEGPYLDTEGRPECRFFMDAEEYSGEGAGKICAVTTGKRALEYCDAIYEGSSVFVNGALRSVRYTDRTSTCPRCGAETPCADSVTELMPFQVEYHAGCDIPEPARAEEEEE